MAGLPEPKAVAEKQAGLAKDDTASARAQKAQAKTVIERRPDGSVGQPKRPAASPVPRATAAVESRPGGAEDASEAGALKPLEASGMARLRPSAAPAKLDRMAAEDIFVAPPRPRRRMIHRSIDYLQVAGPQRLGPLARLFVWFIGAVVVLLLGASLARMVDRDEAGPPDLASQSSASD